MKAAFRFQFVGAMMLVCEIICSGNPQPGAGAEGKPANVRDYFHQLPQRFFEDTREKVIPRMLDPKRKPIVDLKNGYIYAPGDGAQPDIHLCLFRRKDGSFLIGVKTFPGDTREYTYLHFLDYDDGRWTEVTGTVLPVKTNETLVYEMPRYGTTIRVKNKMGRTLYNLLWTRGKFVQKLPGKNRATH